MKQWESTKMLVNIAKSLSNSLSLALQKKETDKVNSSNSLLKIKSKFCKLELKTVELNASITYLIQNTAKNNNRESLFNDLLKIFF